MRFFAECSYCGEIDNAEARHFVTFACEGAALCVRASVALRPPYKPLVADSRWRIVGRSPAIGWMVWWIAQWRDKHRRLTFKARRSLRSHGCIFVTFSPDSKLHELYGCIWHLAADITAHLR